MNDVDSSEVVERVVTQYCVSVRFSNGLIFYSIYSINYNITQFLFFQMWHRYRRVRRFNRHLVFKVEVII